MGADSSQNHIGVAWVRHKNITRDFGSSQNHFGGYGLVTKSLRGTWARHKMILGNMGSSQNQYGGIGLVTKSFLGARHKIILINMDSSQNHHWGDVLVTKPFWSRWIRHKIILMSPSQNHFDHYGFVTKSFWGKSTLHRMICLTNWIFFRQPLSIHCYTSIGKKYPIPIDSSHSCQALWRSAACLPKGQSGRIRMVEMLGGRRRSLILLLCRQWHPIR